MVPRAARGSFTQVLPFSHTRRLPAATFPLLRGAVASRLRPSHPRSPAPYLLLSASARTPLAPILTPPLGSRTQPHPLSRATAPWPAFLRAGSAPHWAPSTALGPLREPPPIPFSCLRARRHSPRPCQGPLPVFCPPRAGGLASPSWHPLPPCWTPSYPFPIRGWLPFPQAGQWLAWAR